MRIFVITILIIFSAQCAYLHAVVNPLNKVLNGAKSGIGDVISGVGDVISDVGDIIDDGAHKVIPECFFGVKSVSIVLYTGDIPEGKNIQSNEACNDIDPSKPIVFLVHGFISSANNSHSYELASSLVEDGYTVFSLDWSDAACTNALPIIQFTGYPSAVNNTREIGEHMAKYVITLIKECDVSLAQIKFIGHSLGSHVSAFAAKKLFKLGHGLIPRLFAADPAAPLFEFNKCENRLCDTDADKVIVLHTSHLGIRKNIGHLDLYFNGGEFQPGCGLFNINIDIACSHSSSILYLSDIIKNQDCVFPGVPSKSSFLEEILKRPSYPNPETTDCIVVDANIFNSDCIVTGEYYVFVESDSMHCTQKKFNCETKKVKC